jgi:hypothetical protein
MDRDGGSTDLAMKIWLPKGGHSSTVPGIR